MQPYRILLHPFIVIFNINVVNLKISYSCEIVLKCKKNDKIAKKAFEYVIGPMWIIEFM